MAMAMTEGHQFAQPTERAMRVVVVMVVVVVIGMRVRMIMIIGVLRIRPACRRSPLIRHSRLLNDVLLSDNAGAGCRFRNRSRVSGLVYPAARKGEIR